MKDLKRSISPKEGAILDYALKNVDLNKKLKVENLDNLSKNFNSITENLKNKQKVNEREFRMQINDFIIGFEQNMQVLLSLANLFEQRTIFEIEKKRNSILKLVSSINLDPYARLQLAKTKLDEMTNMIKSEFESVKNKIEDYQKISDQKIFRSQNSFFEKIKKFLK